VKIWTIFSQKLENPFLQKWNHPLPCYKHFIKHINSKNSLFLTLTDAYCSSQWASTFALESTHCDSLLIEPSCWAQTVHTAFICIMWLNSHALCWMHFSACVFTTSRSFAWTLFPSSVASELLSDWPINRFLQYICLFTVVKTSRCLCWWSVNVPIMRY